MLAAVGARREPWIQLRPGVVPDEEARSPGVDDVLSLHPQERGITMSIRDRPSPRIAAGQPGQVEVMRVDHLKLDRNGYVDPEGRGDSSASNATPVRIWVIRPTTHAPV